MSIRAYLDSVLTEATQFSPVRSILFDGVTGLPTLPLVIESLKDLAVEQNKLGIIYIDANRLETLEQEFGWELIDTLLNHVRVFLDSVLSRFAPLRIISIHRMPGDSFLLFLSSAEQHQPVSSEQLSQISSQLEEQLSEYLAMRVPLSMLPFTRVFLGHSVLHYNSNVRFERLISRSINHAFQSAVNRQERAFQMQVQQLQEIINGNQIRILFQPIFSLKEERQVLGYETLSRGPEGTLFESADFMFTLAGSCGLLNRLENLCQVRLLSILKGDFSGLIFVNLEPSFLEHEQYRKLALFHNPSVTPQNVVLEITERVAIRDYELVSRALESIRERGFRIAVDDVGSGYASLQSIACLKPDFIKINEKMVKGISGDFIKQEIVKSLRGLALRLSASLIAEGIEDPKDLEMLQELEVPFGQGYLLKRPAERPL